MTALTFTRATKKALKARIALEGPSGSGKTYTALLTARALVGPAGRIAVIDTEKRSASLYADLFDFDTLELDRFAPEVLIEALAAAASHDVCITDSFSHFWMGQDGMLEQVDRAAKRSGGGNTFAGWKDMRPIERRMIDAMLAYPGHLIATLRTKTEWVVEENDRGKKVPKKIGLKAEQREGLEYEFTLVGTMDLDNTLVVTKSRCPALSGAVVTRPDESFGKTLLGWLDSGESASVTAAQLRDELLANPAADLDEIRAVRERAKVAGLLGTAILDEYGDTTTFDQWIIARGNAVAPPPAPATPAPAPAPAPSTQEPPAEDLWEGDAEPAQPVQEEAPAGTARPSQHRRMHALWNQLGYGDDRAKRLATTSRILRRPVDTSGTLTEEDADTVLAWLDSQPTPPRARPAVQRRSTPADATPADAAPAEAKPAAPSSTPAQRRRVFELLTQRGHGDPAKGLAYINQAIAPAKVGSTKELDEYQAATVIGLLEGEPPRVAA